MSDRGGKVLLLGVHTVPQTIATGRVFFHEVSIVGAFGYDNLGPRTDYDESLSVLDRYKDAVSKLVTHTFPLEEASKAFETSLDKRSGAIKVTVLV
jgi:L-iditol 2-dehydrogenase